MAGNLTKNSTIKLANRFTGELQAAIAKVQELMVT